jgi:FkbM family methyltransferase
MLDLALDPRRPLLWKSVIGPLRRLRMLQRAIGVREVKCRYFGADFAVDLQDGYGFDVATHRFEHADVTQMVRALRRLRPTVFVDVGAHMGVYSSIVAATLPTARIVALEPDATTFPRLERQIAHCGLQTRATLMRAAAGASSGTEVSIARGTGEKHLWTFVTHNGDGHCRAPLVSLDSLDLPRGDCIAIKIDVDGYELEVLRGGADFFASNCGYAQIEALGENVDLVAERMAGAGWRPVYRFGINSMFEKP